MKLLAILKDSYREAVDSRVFPVLIGLSCLAILVFAGMGFEPQPFPGLGVTLQDSLNRPPPGQQPTPGVFYWIRDLTPLEGEGNNPSTPWKVTVSARFNEPADADEARRSPGKIQAELTERLGRVDEWRVLRVNGWKLAEADGQEGKPPDPRTVLFQATAEPMAHMRYIWPYESSLFFGAIPLQPFWEATFERPTTPSLGFQLWYIEDQIVNGPGAWLALVLSVVVTSFFVPSMMRKGTLDLLLVKPISRPALIVYKYLGGMIFIFLNTAFAVGGIWVVLGLRTGVWEPTFLLTILLITFFFAILYAISVLVGVASRNVVVPIIVTLFLWAAIFGVGRTYTALEKLREEGEKTGATGSVLTEGWLPDTARVVHHVLPRTDDLNFLITGLLAKSLMPKSLVDVYNLETRAVNWGEGLGVSAGYIVLFLALASWRFARTDY